MSKVLILANRIGGFELATGFTFANAIHQKVKNHEEIAENLIDILSHLIIEQIQGSLGKHDTRSLIAPGHHASKAEHAHVLLGFHTSASHLLTTGPCAEDSASASPGVLI